ncbi:MAG: hypothetical protein EP344_06885 [Bacteroidetes bacterium]|nr:MAG: hypothetical protein EP344_06885 [Bacteroidota bacterium]
MQTKATSLFLLTVCLAGGLCLSLRHGGHQAFFSFRPEGDRLSLIIQLEAADIKSVLSRENSCAPDLELPLCTEQYLLDHFHCQINTTTIRPELESFAVQQGVLTLRFSIPVSEKKIDRIDVENTCFNQYEHDRAYESIVRFALAGRDQSFKMDRQRTRIIFKP